MSEGQPVLSLDAYGDAVTHFGLLVFKAAGQAGPAQPSSAAISHLVFVDALVVRLSLIRRSFASP